MFDESQQNISNWLKVCKGTSNKICKTGTSQTMLFSGLQTLEITLYPCQYEKNVVLNYRN